MRENRIPDVLDRSVMSLHEGAKTRVRVDSELSVELEAKLENCAVTFSSCSGGRCCQ